MTTFIVIGRWLVLTPVLFIVWFLARLIFVLLQLWIVSQVNDNSGWAYAVSGVVLSMFWFPFALLSIVISYLLERISPKIKAGAMICLIVFTILTIYYYYSTPWSKVLLSSIFTDITFLGTFLYIWNKKDS